MVKNYFKVAIRSFINQKYYSLINTLGLSLGAAACMLILLFVQDELSYESGFRNKGNIYRLVEDFPMGNHLSQSATVPFPTKQTMLNDFPSISKAALIYRPSSWGNTPVIKKDDQEFYEDNFIFAEHDFLEIYDFEFIKGDPEKALRNTDELILTESTAKKYFGNEDPIGKTLNLGNFRDLQIIGVIKDLPDNTHLAFDMMASFETFRSFFAGNPTFFETQWVWVAAWMYFTVEDPAEAQKISDKMPDYVKQHYPKVLVDRGVVLRMQNADDIHLKSNLELEFKSNSDVQYVYLFSSIAILILIIAIINFMNLSTSRSARRSKEVGIRKVMGAQKKSLIFQFMGEAMLTSFLALVIAIILIYLALPWFNDLSGKNISIDFIRNFKFISALIILGTLVGLIAGSYPALVLSSFVPTQVLKGRSIRSDASSFLRKCLVVGQFVISISLIICIGIVFKQMKFVQNKDLGFDKEQIILADFNFNNFNQLPGFKNEILKNQQIKGISFLGGSIPGEEEVIENAFVEKGNPIEESQYFSVLFAGYDFEKIINVEFLQGHSFAPGSSVDSTGFIINESAARALGWDEDVLGRTLDLLNASNGNILQTGQVIGLVKDFVYRPLYDPIKPLVISPGGGKMAIKIQSDNINETVSFIELKWKTQFQGNPFRHSFMDDNFDHLYQKERKFSRTIEYFSILAIFIACLGLLGLSSYTTEARKKEIGIRKVNGASIPSLLVLLSMEFSKLVLIAFLISIPIGYFFGTQWLSSFAYRIGFQVDVFVIAGFAAFILALLTVSYHTLRVALSNPISSLRYE